MTAVLSKAEQPGESTTMAGWNVVADLTPPELIDARRLAVIQRCIGVTLIAIILMCGAGYAYAGIEYNSAFSNADQAAAETSDLAHSGSKYAGITQIESTVDALRGQVATVMQDDVDVAGEIAAIRAALPSSMSIQNLTLTLTPSTEAGTGTTVGLDASGHTEIGLVTISGSGRNLDDLPAYVDRLVATRGIVNVLPSSNLVSGGTAQFNLTFSLTDQLYSHRFDSTATGGN